MTITGDSTCELCKMHVFTRRHHLTPRSKRGKDTIDCCETCENYLHKTFTNNELRDTFNSVDAILADERFQRFLLWRRKQPAETVFKSDRGQTRSKRKYS